MEQRTLKERQLWYLPEQVILEHLQSRQYSIRLILIITIILAAFILWSAIAKVPELSVALGEITTEKKINIVQHLEGGIITKVLVKEGDRVKQNQPLIQLDETIALSDLKQLQARRLSLIVDIQTLESFIKKKPLVVRLPITEVQGTEPDLSLKDSILKHELGYQYLLQAYIAKQEIIKTQIEQKNGELNNLIKQEEIANNNVQYAQQELAMYQSLSKKGYVAKIDIIKVERAMNNAIGEQENMRSRIQSTKESLIELQKKLEELIKTEHKEITTKLNEAQAELLQVQFGIDKLKNQFKRTTITAPVTGTIVDLKALQGALVEQSGILLRIVPHESLLQAEVKVKSQDIGKIHLNDRVNVKISSYPFLRYGTVSGTLSYLSATTLSNNNEEPYYKAIVTLDRPYVGKAGNHTPILPGMLVEADIMTGKKTILEYLLKPGRTAVASSFHER